MKPPTCNQTATIPPGRRTALDEIAEILLEALERADVADASVANVALEPASEIGLTSPANDSQREAG